MVRFRPCGERSSTLEGSVAGESVPIADRCSRGKRLTPTSSREIATLSLRLAFAPSARPPEHYRRLDFARSSRPLAKRLPLHLIARWRVDETWATVRQPTAHSRRRRIPSSAAIWMLDPSALAREGGADSAGVGAASRSVRRNGSSGTRLGRIRPFGDDATSTGDGSTSFASKAAAATRCGSRSNPACGDLVSDDCASGFEVVASLGRRRTSTVNEGTARLNVVLDTAHRSAVSSRRRRPCEAKRNKAIGDYRETNGPSRPRPRDECLASDCR